MGQILHTGSTSREEVFADSIRVDSNINENTLSFPYTVKFSDKTLNDTIEFIYEFELDLTDSQVRLLEMGMTIFLAQTFLCRTIDFHHTVDDRLLPHYNRLLTLLYNLRNYKEETDIAPPLLEPKNAHVSPVSGDRDSAIPVRRKRAVNLISGGKDSVAAAILLERNGFEVINCFIAGFNLASGDAELTACKKIYGAFSIVEVRGFEKIIDEMSRINFPNERPSSNNYTIIYARDLLSILFVLPIALRNKANYLSFGAERDVWKSNIEGKNGTIPMQDTQSELTVTEINRIIKSVIPEIHLFSPIAGLSEISILSWLLQNRPEVVSDMSSCFHGNWCGRCWKCTRYYLIQRFVGVDVIRFLADPLEPISEHLEKFLSDNPTPGAPYNAEIMFLLQDLGIHNPASSGKRPRVTDEPDANATGSDELFRTHAARLIPPGFRRKL